MYLSIWLSLSGFPCLVVPIWFSLSLSLSLWLIIIMTNLYTVQYPIMFKGLYVSLYLVVSVWLSLSGWLSACLETKNDDGYSQQKQLQRFKTVPHPSKSQLTLKGWKNQPLKRTPAKGATVEEVMTS